MSDWRERLDSAEQQRAENSAYWTKTIPALFREHLVPAAEEFIEAVGAHVTARLETSVAENKVIFGFDDWHLGEWAMTIQLTPSTQAHTWAGITCPPQSTRHFAITRDLANPKEIFLEWLTDVYLERTRRT